MKYLALLPFVALAACNDVTAPTDHSLTITRPNYAVLVNEKADVPSVIPITACNGEPVTLAGTSHFVFSFTSPRSGGINAFISIVYNLSGFGAVTGVKYVGRLSSRQKLEQNAASVFSSSNTIHLVSQGSAPNTLLDFEIKVTVDANGEPTVERVDFSSRCQ